MAIIAAPTLSPMKAAISLSNTEVMKLAEERHKPSLTHCLKAFGERVGCDVLARSSKKRAVLDTATPMDVGEAQ